jgi:hypothetical protein
METILKYLKQPSTIRGIIGVLGAVGVALNPEQIEAIVAAVVAGLGVVEVFRNEDKPTQQ